jgi:hypothetical protein
MDPKIILDNRLRKIEARLAQVEDQVGISRSITKQQKLTLELLAGFSFTLFVILGLRSIKNERLRTV